MTSVPRSDDVERLLGHDAFVRGLARQLVRDANAADDAAQATWLAAVQRGPAGADEREVRGFLATVLRRIVGRNARSERREAARRERRDHEWVVPSPDEILAREAQRAAVVREVLALEPTQRDVVLLRFFENLPPRAIAKRLGVPVETVRTRLKRALAKLRERLDERDGGRAAWIVLLQPFADAPVGPPWAPTLGPFLTAGGLTMSMQKTVALVAAIAVLALGWWTITPPDPGPTAPGAGNEPAALVRAEIPTGAPNAPSVVPDDRPAAATVRSAARVPPAPTTGALTVRVVRANDDTPVPGCIVQLEAGADPVFDQRRQRTGPDGSTTFLDVPPRRTWAQAFPGISDFSGEVTIEAGTTATATIRLERVMDVDGLVVDAAGKPIGGAEVLVADWGGTEAVVAGRTAVDGTFALRGLTTHCHIGARAVGFAASPLRQFGAAKGALATMRVVLDTVAGEVHGRVLDPEGRAVAGAFVRCGDLDQKNERLDDGAVAMTWRPETTTTGDDGTFVLRHLPQGAHPLAVRAREFAPKTERVHVTAGGTTSHTVLLEHGVTLVGRATNGNGDPVRASIEVGDWQDLGARRIRAAADGTFRIEGLAVGPLTATASADGMGNATESITGAPGETVTWNPVLTQGRLRKGRVVDASGRPVVDALVQARVANGETGTFWAHESTDSEGRFTLVGCPDVPLRIDVTFMSTFPEVVLPRVAPGDDELRIELPGAGPIHIVGTVVGPDGKVLPVVAISPYRSLADISPAEAADAATGAFRLGPYPPGEYSLTLSAAGFPDLRVPKRTVASGATWDLGELRFARGGELLCALAGTTAAADSVELTVRSADETWIANVAAKDGVHRCGPLPPGDYRLHVLGEFAAAAVVPFTIRGDEVTRIDVPLRTGAVVTLVAKLPASTGGQRLVEFTVRDARGELVGQAATLAENGLANQRVALAPGRYRLTATADDVLGATDFEVTTGGRDLRVECSLAAPK